MTLGECDELFSSSSSVFGAFRIFFRCRVLFGGSVVPCLSETELGAHEARAAEPRNPGLYPHPCPVWMSTVRVLVLSQVGSRTALAKSPVYRVSHAL